MVSRYLKMALVGLILASGVAQAHDWDGGWKHKHYYLHQLREACEAGERHACVRLGMVIGEHRAQREAWQPHPPGYYDRGYRAAPGAWYPDRFR
jgi:hypothetical protein